MEFLIGLACVLFIITLIGHGLWSVAVRLVGYRVQYLRRGAAPARSTPAAEGDGLSVLAADLTGLLDRGLIAGSTHADVMRAIRELRRPTGASEIIAAKEVVAEQPRRGEDESPTPSAATEGAASPPPLPVAPQALADAFDDRGYFVQDTPPVQTAVSTAPLSVPKSSPSILIAPPPLKRRVPRKPLSDVLAAFMEQKNIRWGELVGGLLIIGCSVALVVSFWSEIAQRPFLKFGVFTAVTVALFGLGLYSEHRWKLPTTSRGILLIATLLVPVNLLAFAAFSGRSAPGAVAVAAEGAALAIFLALMFMAAKVIAPAWPKLLSGSVIAISASLLIIRLFEPFGSVSTGLLYALGGIPVVAEVGASAAMMFRARRWRRVRPQAAAAMFLFLGVVSFAAALAVALAVCRTQAPVEASRQIAPLFTLAVLPMLAVGLFVWRRATNDDTAARTAGLAVAILGTFVLLASIAAGWPNPASLLPAATGAAAALAIAAILCELPAGYVLAAPCLLVAWLVAFHILWSGSGHVGWITQADELFAALRAPSGGAAMLPLVAIVAGGSWLLRRRSRPADALVVECVSVALAAISLALVNAGGLLRHSDPSGAMWLYLAYGVAALAAGIGGRRELLAWVGWTLLLAASVEWFVTRTNEPDPWPLAMLAFASTATTSTLILRRTTFTGKERVARPGRRLAAVASGIAVIIALVGISFAAAGNAAGYVGWASAIWLALAVESLSVPLLFVGEAGVCAAVFLFIVSRLARRPWFADAQWPLLDPWSLQAEGIALAGICLIGALMRLVIARIRCRSAPNAAGTAALPEWLPGIIRQHGFRTVEFLFPVLVALLMGLGAVAAAPGMATELSSRALGLDARIIGASLHASGWGSWVLLAILSGVAIARIESAPSRRMLFAALTIVWCACLLWAGRWMPQQASASAFRWSAALFLIGVSVPLWLRRPSLLVMDGVATGVRVLSLILSVLPILGLTLFAAAASLAEAAAIGPAAGSFFGKIGLATSYAAPLLAIVGVFVGHGARERSANYTLAAAMVLNLTVTLGYALAITTSGNSLGEIEVVRLFQLNAIAACGFAIAWAFLWRWSARDASAVAPSQLILLPRVAMSLLALLIVPAGIRLIIFASPLGPSWASETGGILSWAALTLCFIASVVIGKRRTQRTHPASIGLTSLMIAALAGLSASHWNVTIPWASFHTMMAAEAVTAWVMLGLAWLIVRREGELIGGEAAPLAVAAAEGAEPATPISLQYHPATASDPRGLGPPAAADVDAAIRWAFAIGLIVVGLALRAMLNDPGRPWWSVTAMVLISMLAGTIACWRAMPGYLYGAGLLLNLAATCWLLDNPWNLGGTPLDLVGVNIIVLASAGIASLVLELTVFRRMRPAVTGGRMAFHHAAAVTSTAGSLLIGACLLGSSASGIATAPMDPLLAWASCVAAACAMAASLWDSQAAYAPSGLYMTGISTVAVAVWTGGFSGDALWCVGSAALGVYGLLTGLLWSGREAIAGKMRALYPPLPARSFVLAWLAPANTCIATITVAAAFWSDFAVIERQMRLLVALAALTQTVSLAVLARDGARRTLPMIIAALSAIAMGWAWLPPGARPVADAAAAALMAAMIASGAIGGVVSRLHVESPWRIALRRSAPVLAVLIAVPLFVILANECFRAANGQAALTSTASVIVVLGTLLAACAGCLFVATGATNVSNNLSERNRSALVYAAEAFLALALVHLRLTEPQLFGGLIQRYWPLAVMALAFVLAGCAEVLIRRGKAALGEPLHRTAIFLPVIVAAGFWALVSSVNCAALLLVVSSFYATLAILRHSFGFSVAAALAANGALWHTLAHQPGWSFAQHPQLWLIPPALSVLAAAQFNRERLGSERLRGIRYLSLMIVYASSAADVFLNGVVNAPWLPLVLAILSVAGVLAGITFRIRPFLYLGTAFLTLALLTMIWSAQQNLHWTWLWYVAGIALGACIIAVFALFEKKREEMLAMVDGLKKWD